MHRTAFMVHYVSSGPNIFFTLEQVLQIAGESADKCAGLCINANNFSVCANLKFSTFGRRVPEGSGASRTSRLQTKGCRMGTLLGMLFLFCFLLSRGSLRSGGLESRWGNGGG